MTYNLDTFYQSSTWQKFREAYLAERIARDGELIDDITKRPILKKGEATLHHIEHLTDENVNDPNISLNPKNIELVSTETHQRLHNKFNCNGRTVKIAHREEKEEDKYFFDLVISFDSLKNALCKEENDKTRATIWAVYNFLIDRIKTRADRWSSVLVISRGDQIEFNRIKRLIDAEELKEDE